MNTKIKIRVKKGKSNKVINALDLGNGVVKAKSFSFKKFRFMDMYFFTDGVLKSAEVVNQKKNRAYRIRNI